MSRLHRKKPFMTIRNMLVLDGKVFLAPRPNTLLVSCLRLRIQYIRSYPPYLATVSSIRNLRAGNSVGDKGPT